MRWTRYRLGISVVHSDCEGDPVCVESIAFYGDPRDKRRACRRGCSLKEFSRPFSANLSRKESAHPSRNRNLNACEGEGMGECGVLGVEGLGRRRRLYNLRTILREVLWPLFFSRGLPPSVGELQARVPSPLHPPMDSRTTRTANMSALQILLEIQLLVP